MILPMYSPSLIGTALPIICSRSVFDAAHVQFSNVWTRALSSVVSGRASSFGAVSPGCPGYHGAMGRLTPRTVGYGSSIEKMALRA